ncbi:MAG: DUF934 domain-containing protein [Porticoccaceae bacterium]|jgi:uncharacterized protein (DUF934 family)
MQKLIKGNSVVEDSWKVLSAEQADNLPVGNLLLPLANWLDLDDTSRHSGNIAPWIESGEEFEHALDKLLKAPLIAVHFPTFMDGRGFSTAEILRSRHHYQGELRAIGNLIQDQLFFLKRCGFDSVQLREGTDLEAALSALADFSVTYQTSADTKIPLFRRR